jgi:hypothetical protein
MDGENPGPSDGPPRGSRTTRFEWSLDGEDAGGARPARSLLALSGGPAPVRRRREDAPLDRADSGVHRLTIRDVATQDQHGDQILFDPLGSALSLRVACEVSPSVAALPAAYFTADFLILDPSTSRIVVHKRWCGRLEWGASFWLSMGNHWGPAGYDTPTDWGLRPGSPGASRVFGFRAAMTAEAWLGEHGVQSLCNYELSPIAWFRVGGV